MLGSEFDEVGFFLAIQQSGARALLIGRRALVLLGLPVLTADYDFWLAVDDIARFNEAGATFGLAPSRTAEEARRSGRYVLANDEHVDVVVARAAFTVDGQPVEFEQLWERRRSVALASNLQVSMPSIPDLILTKRIAARPKDLEDIRLLEILQREEQV